MGDPAPLNPTCVSSLSVKRPEWYTITRERVLNVFIPAYDVGSLARAIRPERTRGFRS